MNTARGVPRERWHAMTRLDESGAKSQLGKKAGVEVTAVTRLAVWGNHSATQYPDFTNAMIGGRPAAQVITDENWLKTEFIATVQQRGAAIIKPPALSRAPTPANASVYTFRPLLA